MISGETEVKPNVSKLQDQQGMSQKKFFQGFFLILLCMVVAKRSHTLKQTCSF